MKKTKRILICRPDRIGDVVLATPLIREVKKHFPDDGIISEESSDYNTSAEYVWIIDPLDGTWNFSRAIPIYGVLVAIAKRKEVIAGAAYFPKLEEFYFAQKEKGATLNGKKIHCSDKSDLEHMRILGSFEPDGKLQEKTRKLFVALKNKRSWFAEYGGSGYDMALVAAGRAHAAYFPAVGGHIWDVAAPAIIMGEAGCVLTNLSGERVNMEGKIEVVAANPVLHKKLMKIINNKKR